MTDLRDIEPIYEHPAKFNDEILLRVGALIQDWRAYEHVTVLDPFGGVGNVHLLNATVPNVIKATYAVELEPGWARASAERGWTYGGDFFEFSPRCDFQHLNVLGRWIEQPSPRTFAVVATSCTYGNRMADKHNAKEDSKRLTYAHTLRRNGAEMDDENSGGMQWGEKYRDFHEQAWAKTRLLIAENGMLVLNVKDHVRAGKLVRVSEWHRDTILALGFELIDDIQVEVRGMGFGQNQTLAEGAKIDYEHVYAFRRIK